MVGPLKYFNKPAKSSKKGPTESQWKGPGLYYHRGKGKWSRYSKARDKAHKSKIGGHKKRKWHRPGGVGTGVYRHTTDGRTTAS